MLLTLLLLATGLCVAAVALGQRLGPRAGWVLAAGLAALAGGVAWLWESPRAGPGHGERYAWLPSLDVAIRLRLDGLGLLFALVVLGVGALVLAYAASYLPPGRHGVFFGLLTFFAAAMLGLVLADDVVLLWVMWELTTLCSFLLIQQAGPKGRDPAIRTLVVTGGGGLCLLAAVVLTATATGTTQLSAALSSPVWQERPGVAGCVAVLVALAAFTKSAQFPFHGWLPDAMVASTPVSAYLHAAAMVKAGIFVLLRFSTALHAVPVWRGLLVTVGLLTAVLGAVFALQRFDLKELLAYSTVSQLGFLVATIGLGTGYAVVGALVHVLAHALFKSGLFMAVGLIDHEASTRDIRRLSGLRRAMPATALVLALAAASMAGLPPLFGFVSKEAMFGAMTKTGWGALPVAAIAGAAVAGAVCTFAYSARMLRPLFGAAMPEPPHEAPAAMVAPVGVTALAGVVLGVAGPVAAPLIDAAARAVLDAAPAADLNLWHGLNSALLMSVTVIVGGTLLVWGRGRVDRVLIGRAFAPVRAVDVVEAFRSAAVRVGGRVGGATRSDAPTRHLLAPLLAFTVIVAVAMGQGVPLPPGDTDRPLDWVLAALVTLGVILALRASSRVALVTTVGVVGFSTALLFFALGAPDVAITQLLVEILTVVVMVLLLVRLPAGFHPTGRAQTVGAGVTAALVGAAAAYLGLVVLAHPEPAPAGEAFVAQAYALSGGTNAVNTILVDFRAIDTLGEMVVLGVAAVVIVVALTSRGLLPRRPSPITVAADSPARDSAANTIPLRVIDRVVGPLLVVISAWLFLRGHYQPGGGFIGALAAGAALTLIFLAAKDDWVARLHVAYLRIIGAGIVLAVSMAVVGLLDGAILRPLYLEVLGVQVSTGLVFDVGVYLTVLGLVLATLARLGLDGPDPVPLRQPGEITAREESD
ncbi:MAG: hydrogen gas-evolving membrane-bound hydrogenase subunit E [Tetrasphaera sp.]